MAYTKGYWMTVLLIAWTAGSTGAQAQGKASMSWQHPTTRVDGSALSVDEIEGYHLQYQAPGEDWKYLQWVPGLDFTHVGLGIGENCYRVQTQLKSKQKSDWSEIQCIQIGAQPVAPQIKLMTIEWLSDER